MGLSSEFLILSSLIVACSLKAQENIEGYATPMGCIISTETGQSYCLKAGERSEYRLPSWIAGKRVYVNAAPGTKVLLSDWDNLSYNRIGEFVGTVETESLQNVSAWNGEKIDFDRPLSMRVIDTSQPVGCIVAEETREKYCLPVGSRSGYTLPDWILAKTIYVDAAPGTKVLLSDWDNLSYNRIASFSGKVNSNSLKSVQAWDGSLLDFQKPRSMRVVKEVVNYNFLFPDNISKYTEGTIVLNPRTGKTYKCKSAPSDGFCSQWSSSSNEFEPGVGHAWNLAWDEIR